MPTIHTPVTGTPALVYTPGIAGILKVILTNEASSTVYVGQSAAVTAASGMPLQPRQVISLPFAPYPLYAAAGFAATATTANTNAAANSGTTTLSFAAGFGTAAVNGQQVQVGTAGASEVTTIVSGGGTGTLTVTALAYDHKSASAVTVVTPAGSAVETVYGI